MEQHARTWEESPTRQSDGKRGASIDKYAVILIRLSLPVGMELIHIRILAFCGPCAVLGILNKGSGLHASCFTWQVTSARMAGDVIHVWVNSSSSNRPISHVKAPIIFISTCYMYVLGSARWLLTSLGISSSRYRVTTKYSYYISLFNVPTDLDNGHLIVTCCWRCIGSRILSRGVPRNSLTIHG